MVHLPKAAEYPPTEFTLSPLAILKIQLAVVFLPKATESFHAALTFEPASRAQILVAIVFILS